MDGIARVTVESHIMEYIMRCMYTTFVKIQKGLRVVISWHRDDDTVMITSTQRSATKDLHHALNRFFILYNTVKRNLTFEYFAILGSQHNLMFVTNQLAMRHRRIYVEKARNEYEIKLWGFKYEIDQAIRFVQQLSRKASRRLESPFTGHSNLRESFTRKPPSTRRDHFLPRVEMVDESHSNNNNRIRASSPCTPIANLNSTSSRHSVNLLFRSWVHEPTIFENHLKEELWDVLPEEDSSHVVYSKSFEKKLSQMKYGQTSNRNTKPPSRYSTSEMKRLPDKSKHPKKTSTFPRLTFGMTTTAVQHEDPNQICTATGLVISCTLRDEAPADVGQVLVTEISRNGRLSEEFSWMIAKDRAFQIKKIIKLHISMYGELTPSKAIITPSFQLRYKHLIHVTPPAWDEERVKKSLKQLLSTYKNIFRLADSDIKTEKISIPVLGRCETAGKVFPELVALSIMNQAILSSTKAGFGTLRQIRILCSHQTEFDYIKSKLFNQVMSLQYDLRYIQQQRLHFMKNDEVFAEETHARRRGKESDTPTRVRE